MLAGAHADKGEPKWSSLRVTFEEPKTLTLPVTAGVPLCRLLSSPSVLPSLFLTWRPGHKSSRHLWVGSIDDTVVTSSMLELIFGAFGTLTDRPHINVGRQQGFVDFQACFPPASPPCHLPCG